MYSEMEVISPKLVLDCCATFLLLDVVLLIITTIMGRKESSIVYKREALFVVVRLLRARPSPSPLGMMSSRWMTKEGRPVDDSNVSRAHQLPHSSTPSSSLSDDVNVTII